MDTHISVALIGFLGVLLGVVFQKVSTDKEKYVENITKERKEWRQTIRELTEKLNEKNADYNLLKVKFQIRLNPLESSENQDWEIVELFNKLENEKSRCIQKQLVEELNQRIALLLKHDWERVKLEANRTSFFPYGAVILVLITMSLIIQIPLYIVFKTSNFILFIKNLLVIEQFFYLASILFTIGWILIIYRLLVYLEPSIEVRINKIFGLPVRERYKKNKS